MPETKHPLKHTSTQFHRVLLACVLAAGERASTTFDDAYDQFLLLEPSQATDMVGQLFRMPTPDQLGKIAVLLADLFLRATEEEGRACCLLYAVDVGSAADEKPENKPPGGGIYPHLLPQRARYMIEVADGSEESMEYLESRAKELAENDGIERPVVKGYSLVTEKEQA